VGSIDLADSVFGIDVRADILHRVVNWQLAKRRAGTHKTKTRSEIRATTAKMYKQKGTGRARHATRSVGLWRGGGRAFGPVVRDHAVDLPKKVRALGLRCALSSKAREGKLLVLDAARLDAPRTMDLVARLLGLSVTAALVVEGEEVDRYFQLASRNLPHVDVLPAMGANVYDILRRDLLVLTTDAVRSLEERLA
jgi:large subunit ribosomal protein L4